MKNEQAEGWKVSSQENTFPKKSCDPRKSHSSDHAGGGECFVPGAGDQDRADVQWGGQDHCQAGQAVPDDDQYWKELWTA